ncbi:MAG TPA: GNVR domain-containing protein [Pyrinomonadaceae bacterium]|jgi:polysaccharide chain length determinant protein (PEP-CTERM system associated)
MSVEFRQRGAGEYAKIIWKRKWLIILPAIAITLAIAWVVWRLPNVYESTTLLIVKPPTIPNAIVPTLSDVDLSLRINNIGQVVASRSSLEPLILKYDLYQVERRSNEPMELIVERMRNDISVEVDKSRNDITNAFKITYRERDPRKTQLVTSELADKYVSAQIEAGTNSAAANKQFIEQQLKESQAHLDEVDRQRIQYMTEHVDSLPSSAQALVSQLSGLREQQQALIADIGRMRDQRASLSNQLNDVQQQSQNQRAELIDQVDVKTTLAYGQFRQQKATLEAELQSMLRTLKPANPDVKAKQAQIEAVQKAMDDMVTEEQAKNDARRKRIETNPDLRITGYKSEIKRLDGEIARQQSFLDQNNSSIALLEQRLNNVPGSEVALEALNRDYQTKKAAYDDLLKKKAAIDLAADASSTAQGETLQVIDPANLPQQPVAPKRLMLMLAGLALGLLMGLVFVGLFEAPRLLTIQTTEDVTHYTGLPVLVAVPELLTPQEARWLPRRRLLLLAAGIAATIVSIPLLAFVLKMTHVFDRFIT